jgi:transcriptional regulator with XRE-family HTH domain
VRIVTGGPRGGRGRFRRAGGGPIWPGDRRISAREYALETRLSDRADRHGDIYAVLALQLRSVRRQRGLTIEELADMAGLSHKYVGNLERAERKARLDTVERLARALDVEAADLLRKVRRNPVRRTAGEKLQTRVTALVAGLDDQGKRKLETFVRRILMR